MKLPEQTQASVRLARTVGEAIESIHAALLAIKLGDVDPDVLEELHINMDISEMVSPGERIPTYGVRYLAYYLNERIQGLPMDMLRILAGMKLESTAYGFVERYFKTMRPDVDIHVFLVNFLIHVKLLPKNAKPDTILDPIPIASIIAKARVDGAKKEKAKDWKKKKEQPILASLEAARKESPETLQPIHIASVLPHVLWNGCKDILELSSPEEAVFVAVIRLQQSFGGLMSCPLVFLSEMGIYPVDEASPCEERVVRERAGALIFEELQKNVELRRALAMACQGVLSFQKIASLVGGIFCQDEQHPHRSVVAQVVHWLEAAEVEDPMGFLRKRFAELDIPSHHP